ncbi:hypothetical protein RHMOL_Rhmol04G0152300 [Rhododendron molle]|uniref:Uncharacterized protein n=1 Tax=Rhododendron molle TaxID=49168 RepID=A0ACC0P113_RHOML|nr:hypothetical protein RHMOL_Rhmol04G0152300 [Rhododendron molle]
MLILEDCSLREHTGGLRLDLRGERQSEGGGVRDVRKLAVEQPSTPVTPQVSQSLSHSRGLTKASPFFSRQNDDDFSVVATDNNVQEAAIASMVTIDVWPKLGTVDPSPGLNSSAKATESWAQWVWKIDTDDVITLDNGFFVFNFSDAAALDYILENDPYFCGGKHIVIKKWHLGMHLTKGAFSSVLVWVKLYNVPLESWTEDGLSYIGNPLYLDEFTQDHSRLTFAHVCIEMEAAKKIPKSFVVNLGYSGPYEIRVEVPCKPQVGQVVPVVQERAAKERVDEDKDEWLEVKRKKAKRTRLAISSSLCVSSTANEVGDLERCEESNASAVVKVTNKDDARTVPPSVVPYPVSCFSTPVVHGRGSNQPELPVVALR